MNERYNPVWLEKPKQRAVMISESAWKGLREQSIMRRASASVICRRLLENYLETEEKPAVYELEDDVKKKKRTLHISDFLWSQTRMQALREERTASSLVEQLIREYLGMDLGVMKDAPALPSVTGDNSVF
ncbi:MAG: hypothetical protein MUO76_01660 [Anaerolineaceae bacterium]|jgi:hypothetical protein|nr:hypothetical protein [Anaerolineaceae bacterium]